MSGLGRIPAPNAEQEAQLNQAVSVVHSGRPILVVTHSGVAHPDDFLVVALTVGALGSRVAAVVRVPDDAQVERVVEDALGRGYCVAVFDIGHRTRYWREPRDCVAILDHHIQGADVARLPSSIGLGLMLLRRLGFGVPEAWLDVFERVDRRDAMGPVAMSKDPELSRWRGLPWGYFLDTGMSDAMTSINEVGRGDELWRLFEDIWRVVNTVEPRPEDVAAAMRELAREALEEVGDVPTPFGEALRAFAETGSFDEARRRFEHFGVEALAILYPYLNEESKQLLKRWFVEALRKQKQWYEAVARAEVEELPNGIKLLVVDTPGPAQTFYDIAVRIGKVRPDEPVVVVAPSPRGGIMLWRHDKFRDRINFATWRGRPGLRFTHPSGFIAVTETEDITEAKALARRYLAT